MIVGNQELPHEASANSPFMAFQLPVGSAFGAVVSFTIAASDGGAHVAMVSGELHTFAFYSTSSSGISCVLDPTKFTVGELTSTCNVVLGANGEMEFKLLNSVKFPESAPIVTCHIWYTITYNSNVTPKVLL